MADSNFVVKNTLVVNNSFIANSTQFSVGNNTTGTGGSLGNTTTIFVGNNTQNTFITTVGLNVNAATIANTIGVYTTQVNAASHTTGTATSITTGTGSLLANVTTLFIGNSIVNTFLTSAGLNVNNATVANNSGVYTTQVNAASHTTGTATTITTGAGSLVANVTTLFIGNSIVNTFLTSAGLNVNNSTVANNTTLYSSIHTTGGTGTGAGGFLSNTTAILIGNNTINTFSNSSSIYISGTLIATSTGPYGKTEGNLNVNSAVSALNANNSAYLGGVAAASYVQNTDSRVLSGNLNFTGANLIFSTATLGGTATNFVNNFTLSTNVGNGSLLRFYTFRHTTGGNWEGASTIIQQRIDTTNQALIEFNPVGYQYGLKLANSSGQGLILDSNGFLITSTNTVTVGTASYFVANGNLGVGSSAPGYKLQVTGGSIYQAQSDASLSRIGLSNTNRHWTISNYGTSASPNGGFVIADETAAQARLLIDTSGNVGIGVIPTSQLDVFGTISNRGGTSSAVGYINLVRGSGLNTGFVEFKNADTTRLAYIGYGSTGAVNFITESTTAGLNFGTGSSGTQRMFIDSNGNVGIGTVNISITSRLTLVGPNSFALGDPGIAEIVNPSRKGISIGWDDTNGYSWIYSRNPGVAGYPLNLNNCMFIGAGNSYVNIGTGAPDATYKLRVSSGVAAFDGGVRLGNANIPGYTRAQLQSLFNLDGTGASGFAWNYTNGGGELDLFINPDGGGTGGLQIWNYPNTTGNPTNIFTVTGAGNVGIGFNTPARQLHLFGEQIISPAAGTTAYLNIADTSASNGGNYTLKIRGLVSGGSGETQLNTVFISSQNIRTNGAIYVNDNDPYNICLSSNQINSPGYDGTSEVAINYTGYNGGTSRFRNVSIFNGKQSSIAFFEGSTGNFTATGSVSAYSDIKLKTDISTIDNALDKVSKMRGVMYTRKDSGVRSTGVIAQEIREVLPEVVLEGETLSVAYGNIVGVLIEAIKELKAEIEQLKSK